MKRFRKSAIKKILKKKAAPKQHVIMLVDDEEHNLRALSTLLQDDYEILTAVDGQDALEVLDRFEEKERIHLIISDQRMPRLTGVEFLNKTLEIIPKAKRILLTGFSDVDAIIDSINKGEIYKFILKPYEPIEMQTTVKRTLEVYGLETKNDRLIVELKDSLEEQRRLVQASSRFVPHDLLHLLEKESITDLELGDHRSKQMAVMFSDVRGFTTLSEQITARESFDYINTYLRRISPIIREHSGFIVKYLGDGMMAVFSEGPEEAIKAGLEKLQAIRLLNEELVASGQAPISVGIGVNIGSMLLGIVGESNRIQGDVLADAVNLTARLESLTKRYGISFLISEDALQLLTPPISFHVRDLGKVRVKGKQTPTSIYEIFDADEPEQLTLKQESKADFEQGIQYFHQGDFDAALARFTDVLQRNPQDNPARYYKERIEWIRSKGLADGWDGVDTIDIK